MKDNYGCEIPTDLVLMPDIEYLNDDDLRLVVDAVWYDVFTGLEPFDDIPALCISSKEINGLCDDSIDDYDGPITEVMQINEILKRWSIEDGFYHA